MHGSQQGWPLCDPAVGRTGQSGWELLGDGATEESHCPGGSGQSHEQGHGDWTPAGAAQGHQDGAPHGLVLLVLAAVGEESVGLPRPLPKAFTR